MHNSLKKQHTRDTCHGDAEIHLKFEEKKWLRFFGGVHFECHNSSYVYLNRSG